MTLLIDPLLPARNFFRLEKLLRGQSVKYCVATGGRPAANTITLVETNGKLVSVEAAHSNFSIPADFDGEFSGFGDLEYKDLSNDEAGHE